MTHEEKVAHWIGRGTRGVEIGPGTSPVPGLEPRPVYVDCFKAFGAEASLADYYGHAGALPFHDHSLDYVVASHVLEHVANPAAALAEWRRVTRPGGIIYLVVPDRRMTFDRTRPLTTVDHLLDDLAAGTTACDPTHIDDFAHGVNWSLFSPDTPPDQITAVRETLARGMHEAVARGRTSTSTSTPSNRETSGIFSVPCRASTPGVSAGKSWSWRRAFPRPARTASSRCCEWRKAGWRGRKPRPSESAPPTIPPPHSAPTPNRSPRGQRGPKDWAACAEAADGAF